MKVEQEEGPVRENWAAPFCLWVGENKEHKQNVLSRERVHESKKNAKHQAPKRLEFLSSMTMLQQDAALIVERGRKIPLGKRRLQTAAIRNRYVYNFHSWSLWFRQETVAVNRDSICLVGQLFHDSGVFPTANAVCLRSVTLERLALWGFRHQFEKDQDYTEEYGRIGGAKDAW